MQAVSLRPYLLYIVAGGLILGLSFGVRQVMGLFIPDFSAATGWPITTFALALALQNLLWGFVSPFAGAIADKHGPFRVLIMAAVLYALGLFIMANSGSPLMLYGSSGFMIGMAVGSCAFPVILGAVARIVPEQKRPVAIAWTTAGGSTGQFLMAPVTSALLLNVGWYDTLLIFACLVLLIVPAAFAFRNVRHTDSDVPLSVDDLPESLRNVLRLASTHRSYVLLNIGFFVCGFHIAFIAIHLPVYIHTLPNISVWVAGAAFSMIGLFNIIGSLGSGYSAKYIRPKWTLTMIYFVRSALVLSFIAAPKTDFVVIAFAAGIGLIWLATVPLTSATVVRMFGPRWLGTLFGIVMMSHQIGSFCGAYFGGVVFEITQSYDLMWLLVGLLSIIAGICHIPIDDSRVRIRRPAVV